MVKVAMALTLSTSSRQEKLKHASCIASLQLCRLGSGFGCSKGLCWTHSKSRAPRAKAGLSTMENSLSDPQMRNKELVDLTHRNWPQRCHFHCIHGALSP